MPRIDTTDVKPNIVLLSNSRAWLDAVHLQASSLGVEPIHIAHSAQEVVILLAGGSPPVSHLLLQANSAGDFLTELIDMTAGQQSGVSLVVIGEPERLPNHHSAESMIFVPVLTENWLERVLDFENAFRRRPPVRQLLDAQELHETLVEVGIQTRYQPIVRLDTGLPVGLEVLARLEHPRHGMLQPDCFVPQLEGAGFAWQLTEAVITAAFNDWAEGRLGSFGLTIALNFPLDVLLIPQALTWLETQRRRAGLPAEQIVIELTESRPVSEIARLRHAISTLRGIGYGIAIDDVGPELRDHEALLDLQFTSLKLDKELVRESADSSTANAFLTRTIAAARAADLTIVAEGVENKDIWYRMQSLGVDQAQGFLVARPLPAAAVPLWYRGWCARLNNQGFMRWR